MRSGGKEVNSAFTHRVTQILLTTNREITPRASRGPTASSADFAIHNHSIVFHSLPAVLTKQKKLDESLKFCSHISYCNTVMLIRHPSSKVDHCILIHCHNCYAAYKYKIAKVGNQHFKN